MDFDEYLRGVAEAEPPEVSLALRALWWDAKGEPEKAQRSATMDASQAGRWVQAYLRRKSADHSDVPYFYWKAGVDMPSGTSEEEWRDIVQALLSERPVANAYGI